MSNTTFGPGARTKKETVYNGPGPEPRQANGPSAQDSGGTVYGSVPTAPNASFNNGLGAGGTVYNNPGAAATVYNPPRQNPAQTAAPTGAKGNIFYLIAGFSVINTLLIVGKAPFIFALGLAITRVPAEGQLGPVLVLNAIAVGVFAALGFFASRGAKAAYLIGLLLYAGDTGLLLLSENPAMHIVSIVFHGIFLFSIFKSYRQLN